MKTVAIIAEFNPAHNGHEYLINKIRESFDEEVHILVLLSGNFVQRGEPAMFDSYTRAKMALAIGADLVLELPLPYSYQTAQIYAKSNIAILKELNAVDYLAFGSEAGNIDLLNKIADCLFNVDLHAYRDNQNYLNLSFAKLREQYVLETLGEEYSNELTKPNNILAIEYLLELKSTNIKPFTIQRKGSYFANETYENEYLSASYIRKSIKENPIIEDYIKADSFKNMDIAKIAISNKSAFLDDISYSKLLLYALSSHFASDIFDVDNDLKSSLLKATFKAKNYSELVDSLVSKNYTRSHIQRAILNVHFDVLKSDFHMPKFTRLLAANRSGRILLNKINSLSSFPIITKNADYVKFDNIQEDFLFMMRCESFYYLTRQSESPIEEIYKKKPTIL